jgi:EAL domain-containing protein (putative c-di-GMP-specific phosphodiesterase class I)
MERDTVKATLVQQIVYMAHQLEMRVTAEGVETERQEAMLRAAGCDSFQGYLYCRPTTAEGITRLLAGATRRQAVAS